MAVAIQIATDPQTLLAGWRGSGWSSYRQGIIRQVPGDQDGNPTIPLQVDAFEWVDVSFFGIGNTDDALGKLRQYIQAGGSDLYAYALFQRSDFNAFGLRVQSYRLVLLHSIVQLLAPVVVILAIAFAAVIFLQYLTTGRSPAVDDLRKLWGSGVTSIGQAVGDAGSGIANTYIWATIAAGTIAIAIAAASKSVGGSGRVTPAKVGPSGSVGVRGGPVSARLSS